MAKTKVAILGGGMSALACAFELTATPELRDRYEVTIHQMGWRLGGKCASGRNRDVADRIEEHGLHMWFGSYENAFDVTSRCYAELARVAGSPLATIDQAVGGWDTVVMYDQRNGEWSSAVTQFKPNDQVPGDGRPADSFWMTLGRAIEHALQHLDHDALHVLLNRAHHEHAKGTSPSGHHPILEGLLRAARKVAWEILGRHLDDPSKRIALMKIDFVTTLFYGILHDRLLDDGFHSIDHLDYRQWLLSKGVDPITADGPTVRSWYDGAFAYQGGDTSRPNIAAGASVHAILRQQFAYKGHIVYHLGAGMGDAIIAPFYEVLTARGVRVEFFHRVDSIGLSDDGQLVDTVTIQRQAVVGGTNYNPLDDVNGLPCWRVEPHWEQLEHGHRLKGERIDFESGKPVAGEQPLVLRRGQAFDVAVLAMSLAPLKTVCKDLIANAAKPAFADMIANGETVMTQALQLWMTRPLQGDAPAGLGWPYAATLASDFVEPLDSFADMSHLIPLESWDADEVKSIVYFCGVVDESIGSGDAATHAVHEASVRFCEEQLTTLFPGAAKADGSLDWDVLADRGGASEATRLDAQFWRANYEPSERYVLTPAGSIAHRLRTDESGYANLFLAGDWIRNGLDLGCVEGAVLSGRQASRAICGSPAVIAGEDASWLHPGSPG